MAKQKRRSIGLRVDKGQFVKAVGYGISKSGKLAARRWYLGAVDDGEDAALGRFVKIRQQWNQGTGVVECEIDGRMVKVWSENWAPLDSDKPKLPIAVAAPTTLTVGEAVKGYIEAIKNRRDGGQVSTSHYVTSLYCIELGAALLGKDKPLSSIGATELEAAVVGIAKRPNKKDGEQISVKTARQYLATLRDFLDEMSKTENAPGSEVALWRKPLKFDDIFRRNTPQLTQVEKTKLLIDEEAEADAYTIDELVTIYKAADERKRLWICAALNFGLTQSEIGSIISLETVGLDNHEAYLRRLRGKTDIYARWPFWDETADLFRLFMAKDRRTDPEKPLIVSEKGLILVENFDKWRNDRLAKPWRELVEVIENEDRRLSFKYLRKTGANLIRCHLPKGIGGDHVAEMYLSHADDKLGVLASYSGRDWQALAVAVAELRKLLQPMFDAGPMSQIVRDFCKLPTADAIKLLDEMDDPNSEFAKLWNQD